MTFVRKGLALAACVSLTACVSMDYGETGPEKAYGYKDVRQDDGSYILSAMHPDPVQAMAFWDRRAEELCGAKTYRKNIYRAIKPTMNVSGVGGQAGPAYLEGTLACGSQAPATTAAPGQATAKAVADSP